jgi:ABC-2 type transport system permease protein
MPSLKFYHDPVLQDNFCSSIINIINAFVKSIEGDLLITQICEQLELKEAPQKLKEAVASNQVTIEKIAATLSDNDITPNSTQHNVPAWTIFAIFFMVISLGNNLVKERLNGSFIRLKTMPTSFVLILGAKMLVYLIAVFLQVALIFSLAKFTFPSIGLPELIMPSNVLAFFVVILMTGMAAISFAMAVGTMASTPEQANGFGAVSIVILASVGGIWVPSFMIPEYLKIFSYCSPMYWCLEGFYTLFLRGGDWAVLLPKLFGLLIFSLTCFGITFAKLKKDRII